MKKDKKNELVQKESLTLSEYEQKYSSKESSKQMSTYLTLTITVVAIFLFIMLFILFKEVYEINEYAGYSVGGIGVLLYIFLFAIPVIKITNMRKFDVDVTVYSSRRAKSFLGLFLSSSISDSDDAYRFRILSLSPCAPHTPLLNKQPNVNTHNKRITSVKLYKSWNLSRKFLQVL